MKHLYLLTVVLLLCASTALAGRDRRQEKLAEEQAGRDAAIASQSFSQLPRTAGILDWSPLNIRTDSSRYKGIDWTPGGAIWIAGNNDLPVGAPFYGYRSTDAGKTWTKFTIAMPTGAAGVTNIAAKDANIAVIGTDIGSLLRTTDGGTTWNKVFEYFGNTAFMDAVMGVGTTRDTMLAYGDADTAGMCIVRSTNAGATWTRIKPAVGDSVNESEFYAGYYTYGQPMDVFGTKVWMSLYFGNGVDPRILVTTDAGTMWQVNKVVFPGGNAYDSYFRGVNFLNANVGWGVAKGLSGSSVNWAIKTGDGGKTWSDTINVEPGVAHTEAQVLTVKPIRGTGIVFAGGFGATTGAKAWWSVDSGKTWTRLAVPTGATTSAWYANGYFKDATHGIAIGRQADIMLSPATSVGEGNNGQPSGFALSQNYPNPFNPATTVEYTLGQAGQVRLAVYDVLGRVVATLVNDVQAAGQHSVRFDASRLSSGVYYYTLRAGEFSATRSLVLMK